MGDAVKVREHQWCKMKITPISVLEGLDGEPSIFVDPEKEQAAEEVTQYGCFACLIPLTAEGMKTECAGDSLGGEDE